ncbi:UDP-glucose 4-epimerase GalE, partial [Mycobacterium sp. ITM-2017-0098]
MRILVTGGAGYVGANVCQALRQAHHDVAIVDNFSTGLRSRVHAGTPVYAGSLLDGKG